MKHKVKSFIEKARRGVGSVCNRWLACIFGGVLLGMFAAAQAPAQSLQISYGATAGGVNATAVTQLTTPGFFVVAYPAQGVECFAHFFQGVSASLRKRPSFSACKLGHTDTNSLAIRVTMSHRFSSPFEFFFGSRTGGACSEISIVAVDSLWHTKKCQPSRCRITVLVTPERETIPEHGAISFRPFAFVRV